MDGSGFVLSNARTDGIDTGTRGIILNAIKDLDEAQAAATRIAQAVQAQDPTISPSALRMTRFVLEELGANIVQHSGAPETGYAFADLEPSSRRMQLSVADCGIGFLASLQRNPELRGRISDDAEALQLAMTPRVSGTEPSRSNMGWGLKVLLDYSDLLDGELYIASGNAMLVRKSLAGQRTNAVRSIPRWAGSWICVDALLR